VAEAAHDGEPDREWQDHADGRYQGGLEACPQQLAEVGVQAHLEQEDQNTEFGQGMEDLRFMNEPEDARSDGDPGQQFSEHRRLTNPLHCLARDLGRKPDESEPEQQSVKLHDGEILAQRPKCSGCQAKGYTSAQK
jgi:hypothetical protein